MKESIYQLAERCKSISEDKLSLLRTHFHSRGLVYTDYTIRGSIDEYLNAIEGLASGISEKYPDMGYDLRLHKEGFGKDDKIVHFTAMRTIVECVLALEKKRSKRIFISHSSKDKEVVKMFVDHILQLGIGLSYDDIFCTSIEEMGIKNGEDLRNHIRNNIQSADFSFLMISKHYKASEICLNEMGAVWATDNRVRCYLLPDVDFDEIGWLCDAKKADKLANPVVLDSLEEELVEFYGLAHSGGKWGRHRQEFVESVGGGCRRGG